MTDITHQMNDITHQMTNFNHHSREKPWKNVKTKISTTIDFLQHNYYIMAIKRFWLHLLIAFFFLWTTCGNFFIADCTVLSGPFVPRGKCNCHVVYTGMCLRSLCKYTRFCKSMICLCNKHKLHGVAICLQQRLTIHTACIWTVVYAYMHDTRSFWHTFFYHWYKCSAIF